MVARASGRTEGVSMLSTIATDIKDVELSADGKEAKFVLVTKHSGEIGVTVPAQCLNIFRLTDGGASQPAPGGAPAPTATSQTADNRNARATIDASLQPIDERKPAASIVVPTNAQSPADQKPAVTITVPKKWYVGAEADKRLVIVVLDPMTPGQSGFALYPKAAMELAGALVKKAEAMPSPNPGSVPV
jgi:hypothetical protein